MRDAFLFGHGCKLAALGPFRRITWRLKNVWGYVRRHVRDYILINAVSRRTILLIFKNAQIIWYIVYKFVWHLTENFQLNYRISKTHPETIFKHVNLYYNETYWRYDQTSAIAHTRVFKMKKMAAFVVVFRLHKNGWHCTENFQPHYRRRHTHF